MKPGTPGHGRDPEDKLQEQSGVRFSREVGIVSPMEWPCPQPGPVSGRLRLRQCLGFKHRPPIPGKEASPWAQPLPAAVWLSVYLLVYLSLPHSFIPLPSSSPRHADAASHSGWEVRPHETPLAAPILLRQPWTPHTGRATDARPQPPCTHLHTAGSVAPSPLLNGTRPRPPHSLLHLLGAPQAGSTFEKPESP